MIADLIFYPMNRPGLILTLLLFTFLFTTQLNESAFAGGFVKQILPKELDSLNRLDSLVNHYRFSNTPMARSYALRALAYSTRIRSANAVARSYIMLGLVYLQGNSDSSFTLFGKALDMARRLNDDEISTHAYYCLASLYTDAYDYKTAVALLDSSLKYAGLAQEKRVMADVNNLLGNIRYEMEDRTQAKELYLKSFQISKTNSFDKQCGIALVNLAKLDEDAPEAIRKIQLAIQYFRKAGGCDEELAGSCINMADKQNNPDSALVFLTQALSFCDQGNMPVTELGAYNCMAYCYLEKGDLRNAEICLRDRAIPLAVSLNNQDWLATLYDSYADILLAKGDFRQAALCSKKALNNLVASDQKNAAKQVRLLTSLLDVKNKELTIQVKEQELLRQKTTIQKTRFWLSISILLLLIAIAAVLWIRQRGRMKLQQEQIASARKIIELDEREKSAVARDLHDLTGQMQVALLGCFENRRGDDKTTVDYTQSQIREVGTRMRRLSHRLNSNMAGRHGISTLIRDLVEDTEKISGLKVSLELDELAPLYDSAATLQLYRIIQEMLTNAVKYVKNGEIILHLLVEENRILFSYADSGPGFDPKLQGDGMGLMNIYERVKLLRGEVILHSATGRGTSWEVSCPNLKNISKN